MPDIADGWSATRVKDEQTDLVSFDVSGPTKGGDTFRVSIPAAQREEQKRVRKTLRSYDAALPGQVDDDLAFLEKLFDGANVSPLIATSKPGFPLSGKGFVLGAQMLGDAAERYHWLGDDYSTLGQTSGTQEGWNDQVGKLLQHSSFDSIAVLTVLASPVPVYLSLRKSEDPRWRPAVSETSIINLAGESASGKTQALAVAASLSGDPSDRAKGDFSRRGLEEYLHTRNQVGAIFDDAEKHTGEMPLKRAIIALTQTLPDGASKVVSRVARDHDLPRLAWSTFGLSSSPRPVHDIAREEGWIRSLGEQVRLPDLCVPSQQSAAASSTTRRRAPAMWLSSRDGPPKGWHAGSLFTTGTSCRPGLRGSLRTTTPGPCWRRKTISSNPPPAPGRGTTPGSRAYSVSSTPLASSRLITGG